MALNKLLVAALLAVGSFAAQADVIVDGGRLFAAQTGHVNVTFLGSDAGYTDILIFDPTGQSRTLFNGHATPVGTTIDLGSFTAGTELKFQLHVNNTGENFFTGPASANSDGVLHARASVNSSAQAILGFEDLRGGGDRDYNDLQFRVTNVSAVPEPSTWAMLAGGMGLLGFMARRRQRAAKISL
jgi:hypothetical protein